MPPSPCSPINSPRRRTSRSASSKPRAPGRHQGAVLAQAVPGGQRGLEATAGQFLEDPQAGHLVGQQRRLGVAREADLAGRILEGQLAEIEAQHVVRPVVDLPGHGELLVEVAAHAPVLGALPGEHEHHALVAHGLILRLWPERIRMAAQDDNRAHDRAQRCQRRTSSPMMAMPRRTVSSSRA